MKRGHLSAALALLLDHRTRRIKQPFRSDMNHAWYCVGDIFFRQAHFDDAKCAFKRSVASRPDDEDALKAIGNCYDEQKRPKLAERYFRRALGVSHPITAADRASIRFNLANALFDQGRWDDAIELYSRLVKAHVSIRASARKNLEVARRRKAAEPSGAVFSY